MRNVAIDFVLHCIDLLLQTVLDMYGTAEEILCSLYFKPDAVDLMSGEEGEGEGEDETSGSRSPTSSKK